MRRRVHLHGAFAQFHDGPIEIVADTVWQAVEAVTNQVKGFLPDAIIGRKRIQVAGFPTIESLHQPTDVEDIHIVPAMTFGKNGGLIQTIIGVTLIILAVVAQFIPGGQFLSTILAQIGITMIIGGILEMLTPAPKPNKQSQYLPSNQNTVAIGTPIQLQYGWFKVAGQIMSLQIDAKEQGT